MTSPHDPNSSPAPDSGGRWSNPPQPPRQEISEERDQLPTKKGMTRPVLIALSCVAVMLVIAITVVVTMTITSKSQAESSSSTEGTDADSPLTWSLYPPDGAYLQFQGCKDREVLVELLADGELLIDNREHTIDKEGMSMTIESNLLDAEFTTNVFGDGADWTTLGELSIMVTPDPGITCIVEAYYGSRYDVVLGEGDMVERGTVKDQQLSVEMNF